MGQKTAMDGKTLEGSSRSRTIEVSVRFTERGLGISVDSQNVITALKPNGAADKDKLLRAGDVILKVDGHPLAGTTLNELFPQMPRKATYTFTIERTPPPPPSKALRRFQTYSELSSGTQLPLELHTSSLAPKRLAVVLDVNTQHTLSWTHNIGPTAEGLAPGGPLANLGMNRDDELPAGSCNLYLYPEVVVEGGQSARYPMGRFRAEGAQLQLLNRMLLEIALSPGSAFFETPDQVGAFVIHALMVCNTRESLDLSWKIYKAVPSLLKQLHVDHRDGFPLFSGESALHICCVNKQEELLCLMLDLAVQKLSAAEFEALLRSQTTGVFFESMPMRFYGGTALAYACCFELRTAVLAMLATRVVSLNERLDACKITGFLPLHAVTANGLKAMFEWLTKEIPDVTMRANESLTTEVGHLTKLGLHCLNPLQLAARLGDHSTFKHILRKQCTVLWVWGPVTQYSINLLGVDSAGGGEGDVMELIGRIDAKRKTTELLLDSFMQGLLHKLFLQKWRLFGRRIHYVRRAIDMLTICVLLAVAFALKMDLAYANSQWVHALCYLMLSLMALSTEEEARNTLLYYRNTQGVGGVVVASSARRRNTLTWCKSHSLHVMLLSYVVTCAAAIIIVCGLVESPYVSSPETSFEGPNIGANVTLLEWYAYTGPATTPVDAPLVAVLWMLLSLGILSMCAYNATVVFMPFEKLSVVMNSFQEMFRENFRIFLLIFLYFIISFSGAMYVLYPRSGEGYIGTIPAFNTWYGVFNAQLLTALVGSNPAMFTEPELIEPLGRVEKLDMFFFFVLYFFFVLISLILLLNLFIAMLSYTFEKSTEEATLQSRLCFATSVLKLELMAASYCMQTHVGEKQGDTARVFSYRSCKKNSEGGGDEGSEDPFEVPNEGGAMVRIETKINEQLLLIKEAVGTASDAAGALVPSLKLEDQLLLRTTMAYAWGTMGLPRDRMVEFMELALTPPTIEPPTPLLAALGAPSLVASRSARAAGATQCQKTQSQGTDSFACRGRLGLETAAGAEESEEEEIDPDLYAQIKQTKPLLSGSTSASCSSTDEPNPVPDGDAHLQSKARGI